MATELRIGQKIRLASWPAGKFVTVDAVGDVYLLATDKQGNEEPYLVLEDWLKKSDRVKVDIVLPLENGNRVTTATGTVNNNQINVNLRRDLSDFTLEQLLKDGVCSGFSVTYTLPEGEVG